MKLVYVAGPYTAEHSYQVKENIRLAETAGMCIMKKTDKLYPVIPHKNTEHMEGIRDGQYFIDGTKALMLKCDAVLVHPFLPYGESVGTLGEIKAAKAANIPVFFSFDDLYDWVEEDEIKPTVLEKIRGAFTGRTYG